MEENHANVIGSDDEDNNFLIEEEQGLFSSKQTETNYEDSEDYRLGFENAIMEVHRQYDLRSKKNQDASKKKKLDTAIRKTPKNTPKRTAENTNTMAKKPDQNKEKNSQQNGDPSYPITSTSGPEKLF